MYKQGIIIHPEELTDKMIAILEKSNINVLGLHPVGGVEADKSLEKLLQLLENKEFQEKIDKIRCMGISIEYELHALAWLLPRNMYETHPEWFRMNETGERVNDFNMCVSNEEALEYLSSRATELTALLKSDTGRYYFWADDVDGVFCNCEKCRNLSPSDQALIIYHAILKGIRKVDENAKQCYLAYHETIVPPEKIKPQKGIFLEYAPMWSNTKVPIYDKNCEENIKLCEAINPLIEYFGKEDSQILEYWLDNSMFSNWTKPPKLLTINTDTIKKDIVFYRKCGFENITTFGCYLSDDYMKLYGEPPIIEYGECHRNNGNADKMDVI